MSSPTAAGVIHDIGYRRYVGPRLGREYTTWSLYVHSLRTAFGLGRSAVAKIFPWFVFALLMFVAAILVAVQSQLETQFGIRERAFEYWGYPSSVNILVLLFCAIAAPELVSRDLRSGVLPLYFSRPITRWDYPLAKWLALVSALFLLLFGPELLLFLGSAFSQDSMSNVWHEFLGFGRGLSISAIMAVLFASIALLISSLSGRRAVAAAITVGFFILTTPLVGILEVVAFAQSGGGDNGLTGTALTISELSRLASPMTIVSGIAEWLYSDGSRIGPYGPLYLGVTFGVVVVCLVPTLLRFRKVAR
ncbi:MAG TPA: ABC transporter permease subunit [Micromonosporaceae bacterium]|jgi:ABC-2 type transport system permease protein